MNTSSHRMIVPQFWAEARLQHRKQKRQITVRRFGWSDASQEDAQANADARAQEALQKLISGEKLLRREPKIAYNGAHGIPIREEIVSRHGDTIITRNSYGARCLNTPNVLFADIDYHEQLSGRYYLAVVGFFMLLSVLIGVVTHSTGSAIILGILSLFFSIALAKPMHRMFQTAKGGPETIAHKRIDRFLETHANWKLRLYQTPAGMRVMVTHTTFDPNDPVVTDFFKALGTDPIYVRMCLNQQCFRARVSAKPWRIGVDRHIKPRPGVWPVAPERMPVRNAWTQAYEAKAASFAACRFVKAVGKGVAHPDVVAVQELHDALCNANSHLPIA